MAIHDTHLQNTLEKIESATATRFPVTQRAIIISSILAQYDPQRKTAVSVDTNGYGLMGDLLQMHRESWKPVAYRRTMETRNSQTVQERLMRVWV